MKKQENSVTEQDFAHHGLDKLTKLFFLLFYLFLTLKVNSANAQEVSYEQAATNYFFYNIYDTKLWEKLKFSNTTQESKTNFHFTSDCFDNENQSVKKKLFYSSKSNDKAKKRIEIPNHIKLTCFSTSELIVYNMNTFDNMFFYVRIDIYIKKCKTISYFFKLSEGKEVVEWCKSGVVH